MSEEVKPQTDQAQAQPAQQQAQQPAQQPAQGQPQFKEVSREDFLKLVAENYNNLVVAVNKDNPLMKASAEEIRNEAAGFAKYAISHALMSGHRDFAQLAFFCMALAEVVASKNQSVLLKP